MQELVGNQRTIKLLNRDVVANIIQKNGPITKPEIAKKTDLSLVTVNKIVEQLLIENKIKCSGVNESTGGRRAQFFEVNEEFNYNVALLYEHNSFKGIIANSIGEIVSIEWFKVIGKSYDQVMKDTYKALDTLLDKCGDHVVTAIGIGVPGVVNGGIVTNIPTIPSWEGVDIEAIITSKYGIKVILENDINLATTGIYKSQYKDEVDNLLVVYMEEGIGSGLIVNKELFKGTSNFAGELSYMPVCWKLSLQGEEIFIKDNFENVVTKIQDKMNQCTDMYTYNVIKESLLQVLAECFLNMICILNPEIIIIQYDLLTSSEILSLIKILESCINEENIPQIVKCNDLGNHSIEGIVNMCIRETSNVFSLSNKKRG